MPPAHDVVEDETDKAGGTSTQDGETQSSHDSRPRNVVQRSGRGDGSSSVEDDRAAGNICQP